MAELALASAILKPVIEKLSSEIWKQLGLLWGLKGDLNKLKMTLEDIKSTLNYAEQKATTDESVRKWLWDLKDVAYDADDVLDDVQVELLRRSSGGSSRSITAEVTDFFSSKNQVAFRYDIAKKIKKINARLNEIEERKNRFKFPVIEVSVNTEVISMQRETFSTIAEEGLYGRDDDKKRIMTFLFDMDNDKPLSVLPIVGLGGVGKTTLAKMVFNDQRIKEQFEPLIWVCVSENFKLTQVIMKIIHTVWKQPYPLPELENMREKLCELIGGKKFFLVLDDIWYDGDLKQTKGQVWEDVKSLISCGRSGSKVIVTTRDDDNVASVTGTLDSHQLKSLEFEYCWKLFSKGAFKKESEPTPWMEDIGRQIVRKCGGLPLAAKALGGLMRTKQRESEWVAIKNSEIWTLPDKINILPALRLSYLHLPAYLKQCFVYCSLFPKDYRFRVHKLIELWIIEGFISSEAEMHPTDIGYSYFRALRRQSFFQDEEEEGGFFKKVTRCSMHDLIHDLACSIAGPEFAFQGRMLREPVEKWRYLSVDLGDHLPERGRIIDTIYKARKLRSFISFKPVLEARGIDMLSGLPYLRVLSLGGLEDKEVITALHNIIPRLKHLRLLDLSESRIEALPDAIASLHSLQVLDLFRSLKLRKLPRDMSKLTNLRILDINDLFSLHALPPGLGRLSKLEKLSYFVIGGEPGCTIAELQELNMLRGDLVILGINLVKDAQEAKMANLIAKTSLRSLGLFWELGADNSDRSSNSESDINEEKGNSGNTIDCMNSLVRSCCHARFVSKKKETTPSLLGPIDEDTLKNHVLDSLQPPVNLERLMMVFYDGTMFPSWMTRTEQLSMYQNLTILELHALEKCKHLPSLGQLPRLKNLEISHMPCLEQIGSEFYGDGGGCVAFPSLEILKLDGMPNLELWLIGNHQTTTAFPCLDTLELSKCPKLMTVQPCLPSSITSMTLRETNEQVLSRASLGGPSSKLKKLYISSHIPSSGYGGWDELQHLTGLEELTIKFQPELVSLSAGITQHGFPSLRRLILEDLPDLRSLGNDDINNIAAMDQQEGFQDVKMLPSHCSSLLQHLEISSCPELTALPEWLECLPSLQSVIIQDCENLTMVPEGLRHLVSVKSN